MKTGGITLGNNVQIDPSSTVNYVRIGDNVKVAKYCSVFGSEQFPASIGKGSYVGMHSMLNGYRESLVIGDHVSIAQHVLIMVDSGPNASVKMQRLFPIKTGPVTIGDHTWIGANTVIMPNVTLGNFCIVAANSFVNRSYPDYSIIGGSPAKIIRTFSKEEIDILIN